MRLNSLAPLISLVDRTLETVSDWLIGCGSGGPIGRQTLLLENTTMAPIQRSSRASRVPIQLMD